MKEVKTLYKELKEREIELKKYNRTKLVEGMIAENLLTIARVQQLLTQRVITIEGESCKCGNKTFTHRHTNWIECTSYNKIKVLQD